MTTLMLIRHGSTQALGQCLTGKAADPPLSEQGRQEAHRLSLTLAHFGLAALYASPLKRTRETAQFIAQTCGLSPTVVDGLTDVDFGSWSGRPFSELNNDEGFRAFSRYRSLAAVPGGERMVQVQDRMVRECFRIAAFHEGQTVGIVGHLDPLRLMLGYFLGMPVDFTVRIEMAPASLTALRLAPEGASLLCANWIARELSFR